MRRAVAALALCLSLVTACADSKSADIERRGTRIGDLGTVTTTPTTAGRAGTNDAAHRHAVIECLRVKGYDLDPGAPLGEVLSKVAPSDFGACERAA